MPPFSWNQTVRRAREMHERGVTQRSWKRG